MLDLDELGEFEDCVEDEAGLAAIGGGSAGPTPAGDSEAEGAGGGADGKEDEDWAEADTEQLAFDDGGGGDLPDGGGGPDGRGNDDVASFVGIDDMIVDDTQSEGEGEEDEEYEEEDEGPLTQAAPEEPSDDEDVDEDANGRKGAGVGDEDGSEPPARRGRRPVKTVADADDSSHGSEGDSDDDVELVDVVPPSGASAPARATRSRTRREAGPEGGGGDAATSRVPPTIRTRSMGTVASPTKRRSEEEEEPDDPAPLSQIPILVKTRAAARGRRSEGGDGKNRAEEASEEEEPAVLSQVPILVKRAKKRPDDGGGSPAPPGSERTKRVRISEAHRLPRLGETDIFEWSEDDRPDDGGGGKPRGDSDAGTSRLTVGRTHATKPGAPSPAQDSDRENNGRRAAGSHRDAPPSSPADPRTSPARPGGRAQKRQPSPSPARRGKKRKGKQPRAPTVRRANQSPLRIRRSAASARRRDYSDDDDDDFLAAFRVRKRGPAGAAAASGAAEGRGEAGPDADPPGKDAASSQESEVLLSSQDPDPREAGGGVGPGRLEIERLGRVDVAGVVAGSSGLAGGTRRRDGSNDEGGNAAGLDLAGVIARARSLCGL